MNSQPIIAGAPAPLDRFRQFLVGCTRFPNHLAATGPVLEPVAPAHRLLAALLLAALIPRVIMAILIPTVCSDGTTYIASAAAIEHNGLHLHSENHLNLYPLILAGLHHLGISWETAGKSWGVLCSVLVVLPLFGWVRRQFNDRIAMIACLLYAGHPKLIEWSPELIREQTFWLFFIAGLYASWRAAVEVRFVYYLCAALALGAATFTRIEGLFLVIPLAYWTIARFRALACRRVCIARMFLITLVAVPCLLVVAKLAFAEKTPISQWVNSAPIARVEALVRAFFGSESSEAAAFQFDHFGVRHGPFTLITLGRTCQVIFRGLTAPYGILLLIGLLLQGRRSLQSDRLPAVLLAIVTMGAIWVHTWYAGLASSRYILTVAIFSTGTAAAGLLDVCKLIALGTAQWKMPSWQRVAAAGLTAGVFIFGCCDAFTTNYKGRVDKAELGIWIRDRCGDRRVIYGNDEQLDLIAYYAQSRCFRLPTNRATAMIESDVQQVHPDIVLVSRPPLSPEAFRSLTDAASHLGMSQVEVPKTSERRPVVMTALEDQRIGKR